MKKIMICGFVLAALFACKKGEEDKFLSLKSRNARIQGTWELNVSESRSFYYEIVDGDTVDTRLIERSQSDGVYYFKETVNDSVEEEYSRPQENSLIFDEHNVTMEATYNDTTINSFTTHWWWEDGTKKKTFLVIDDDWDQNRIVRLTDDELIIENIDNTYYLYADTINDYREVFTRAEYKKVK